jgi:hypothetical protein
MTAKNQVIGRGVNVIVAAPCEGTIRYLRTPKDVLALLKSGDVSDTVLLARAGTVTFLGPLLPRRPVGIITMEGMPQSHLGILSREFGLPAIMTILLEDCPIERLGANGVPTREYLDLLADTLDGRRVVLDCTDATQGVVLAAG